MDQFKKLFSRHKSDDSLCFDFLCLSRKQEGGAEDLADNRVGKFEKSDRPNSAKKHYALEVFADNLVGKVFKSDRSNSAKEHRALKLAEQQKFEKAKALWEFQLEEVQKAHAEAKAKHQEEIRELLDCPENHGLEYVLNPSRHLCNRCDKQKLELRGCLKCDFFVCSSCEEDEELNLVLRAHEW